MPLGNVNRIHFWIPDPVRTMTIFLNLVRRIRRDTRGATAVEYAMIVGLVAVATIGTLTTLGGNLSGMFSRISDSLPKIVQPN